MKKFLGCFVFLLMYLGIALSPSTADALDVTLAWDANSAPDLAGYKIYYDTNPGEPYEGVGADQGSSPITVLLEDFIDPNNPRFTITGLPDVSDIIHYFTVTAFDTEDPPLESGFSNEVKNKYQLALNIVGSGDVDLSPTGDIYDINTVVTLTAIPDPGWAFSGWSGDLTGIGNPATITMDSDKTITATFTLIPPTMYTLTINTDGNGTVTLNPSGGVYEEGTIVTITAEAAPGWRFSEWIGDHTGTTNPDDIVMTSDMSTTAVFVNVPLAPPTNLRIVIE